ncbi:Agamous-like MADS-box protein AGL97 [Cardamine amara subsp. amara]|uniref:Agamous-like MADS-box protein AGL97 n=1 Tax=Cardamine amara subsp. amara TaxID=228776 RepID=A0ABD1A3Z4_CARAN
MGGTKRKLPMEKIEKKSARAVCFSKRRPGLFTKASEFCLLSGAQMAILTTPPSSESNVSFYSWGHSSVDGVVDSFLKDQCPVREDNIVGCDRWWEDESLAKSENAEELSGAIDSISTMLSDLKKRNLVLHETQKLDDQTLNNLQSTNFGILDDPEMVVFDDQVLAISETTDNKTTRNLDDGYGNQELDLDQLKDFDFETNQEHPDKAETCLFMNPEMDLDELIDFESLFDYDFETNQEHPDKSETNLFMNPEIDNVSMVTTDPNLCSNYEDVEDRFNKDQVLAISESTDQLTRILDGYSNQDLDQLKRILKLVLMNSDMENVSMVTTYPNLCSDYEDGASQRFV